MLLNCHTYYSLRYGTMSEEELLEEVQKGGHTHIALTDINNTSACFNFLRRAERFGIHATIGIDFRVRARQLYVGIAKSLEGFQELCAFLSDYLHAEKDLPPRPPVFRHAWVVYPFERDHFFTLRSNERIGIKPHQLPLLDFSTWKNHREKLVIMATATFRGKKDHNAHRLLRAIENNCLLSKLSPLEQAGPEDRLYSAKELEERFADHPDLIRNTRDLLEECKLEYTFGKSRNKRIFGSDEESDIRLLRRLTYEGLQYRYADIGRDLMERIDRELDIIIQKGFVAYFLISWDIVRYAREKGYYYVGRGSGANSVVAYCLRITDVDPIELDLYFERFINLYRENPPDFDMDFSWKDREDVTRYIFDRHGTTHTALLATYNTFQYRATLRELGKVFGLPKAEIDQLVDGDTPYARLDQIHRLVVRYSEYIQGFPNYLSIHAGGILISDKPISAYSATFMPPKGFPTVQFDMVIAEDIGLYKYDILSQRGLGHIKDTLEAVRYNRGETIDIHDIPRFKNDPGVRHLLRSGTAIGCFYVESPAMRQLLQKMECDDYLSLVAASSIIRPGVARSGMMREYILRYRSPERRKEAHPVMLKIMPETFGVMVYQEDVIKVAHYFAGLSLAEADVLRRGMSGKYRSREEFQRVRDQFFANCKEKGYTDQLTEEIWFQIESFAGYSFSKGHSASYAVESFQSLFLKAHFPLEFMVGVINNFGGFYRTEFYVHEARMAGADIQAPCVNTSLVETLIAGRSIYLGLGLIDSLEKKVMAMLIYDRERNGPYRSLADLVDRIPISLEQVKILIRVGALRSTGKSKKELYWEAHLLHAEHTAEAAVPRLFEPQVRGVTLPELYVRSHEDAFDEMELLGFPLCDPFDLLVDDREAFPSRASELPQRKGQQVTILGYLVTLKPTRTKSGERMFFGTFLDRDGHWLDTTHFPKVANQYPFRGRGVYKITGIVDEEFGVFTVTVNHMEKMAIIQDPRYA